MIKIEKGFSSKQNKIVTLQELSLEHYTRVVTKNGNYKITPIDNLTKELNIENAKPVKSAEVLLKIEFLQKVTQPLEFKKLLTARLDQFQTIIDDYDKFSSLFTDKKYKGYLELFGYSRLRNLKMMYIFALDLGIKTCPYCNNHYTLTIKKSKKANLHFDHFYSKSKYPFLSLSFYNLIPCCAVCNVTKSFKDFDTKDYIHPYLDSLIDKFEVETDSKSIIDMILKGNKKLDNIKLSLTPKKGYENIIKKHDAAFNLIEIYNEHKDIVFEIYSKQYVYTDSFIKSLKNSFSGKFSDSEIDRFILGNYTLPEETNNRPLTKMMQDIHKEAKKNRKKK